MKPRPVGRIRRALAVAGAAGALALTSATSATAATEVGNICAGNNTIINGILLANGPESALLPAAIPKAGVITEWDLKDSALKVSQILEIYRPTGVPKQFTAVGESAPMAVSPGLNVFKTRIPVQAGDHLGLSSPGISEPSPACSAPGAGIVGFFLGQKPPALGTPLEAQEQPAGFAIPVVAIVEPDADGDGFGDETQDQCPQLASTQTECPLVGLAMTAHLSRHSIAVSVTADASAPVTVSATAKLSGHRVLKLKGEAQTLAPGRLGKFALKLPTALETQLKKLPRKRSLTVTVLATATNAAGKATNASQAVKLHGLR